MKKILFLFLFVHFVVASNAQNWKPTKASIVFKVKMFGVNVEGTLGGLNTSIVFDTEHLQAASIIASVDTRTLDTQNTLRNRHLQEKEEFFYVTKYPTIRMKSTKFEKSPNGYIGYFDLSIKSTTRNVKIPFTFTTNGNYANFATTFTINRRDWDVGGSTLGMSNDATVSISVNVQNAPL